MKTFFATLLLLTISLTAQALPIDSPVCQTKLLKVASAALNEKIKEHSWQIGFFYQVSFNYGLPKTPRAVFLGKRIDDNSRVCLLQVYTEKVETGEECPDFKFLRVESQCQKDLPDY